MMDVGREVRGKTINLVISSVRLRCEAELLFRRNCFDGCYK